MTIRDIGHQLRSRQISCVELMRQTLAAAERDTHNSFITLTQNTALGEAVERDRELAAGIDRGPFHGVPIAYKDLFYTQGVRTTGGSLIYRDFVPSADADVVQKLKAAGAISIGKTNLHELAYGITSKNPHFGPVLNPRDRTRLPGGSSGGSAAVVAAGLLPMALGSDTGGSIRIPASYCGIVGFKPTYGIVSRTGVLPLAFSLDHVGPLASCVDDCALTMQAIANLRPLSPASPVTLRVGVPKNFFFDDVDAAVANAVLNSIRILQNDGTEVRELQIPDLNEANAAARVIQYAETASLYGRYTDRSVFGSDVWALIQQGNLIAGHEYVNAQRLRTLFRRDFDRIWKQVDVIIAPTTPIAAPLADAPTVRIGNQEEDTRMASTRLVRCINFLGEPALSMPCGNTAEGLPIGLQLIAAPHADSKLLAIAQRLETLLA